jgi:tRNA(adenine34) deaminase
MEFVISSSEKISNGEVPVFAAIAINDSIIATARNESETSCKPWFHAEFLAIQRAYDKRPGNRYLSDASLYVNLEPCVFCAAALEKIRIGNIFFGAYDLKCGAVANNLRVFDRSFVKPNIVGGIQEERCSKIISEFFKKIRQDG